MFSSEKTYEGYTILFNQEIGKGCYGSVYECRSCHEVDKGIPLCAKVLTVADPKSVTKEDSILKVLMATASLNANIVSVKKVIHLAHEQKMIIIMAKCESNLQRELEKRKQFTTVEVRDFLKQIINGYAPLASQKIIHRDIKPENILIEQLQGKPVYKLADFGVGKILKKNDQLITKTGTPVYAAPEINQCYTDPQLSDELKNIGQGKSQIDMYSIGIILFQLLYGALPFQPDVKGVQTFLQNLKNYQFETQKYYQCDIQLLKTIEEMIKYNPSKRMTYQELCKQYLPQTSLKKDSLVQPQYEQPQNVIRSPQFPQFIQHPQPQHLIFKKSPQQFPLENQQLVQQQIPQQFQQFQIGQAPFTPQDRYSQLQQANFQKPFQHNLQSLTSTDQFLLQLRDMMQNYIDMQNLIGQANQKNQVVILMQKAIATISEKTEIKQSIWKLRQYFKFDENTKYTDFQIKFLFALIFFTEDWNKLYDPLKLTIKEMRYYLEQYE